MALSIKDEETDRLARQLAKATGESITVAVRRAISERLVRVTELSRGGIGAEIRRIQKRLARLPVQDNRPADELLGYDGRGIPD